MTAKAKKRLDVRVARPGDPTTSATLEIGYDRAGSGVTVLLIHGNFGSHRWWEGFLSDPPPGLDLLAPDLPNFRHSSPLPSDWPTNEWVYAWADTMAAFMDGAGVKRAGVVGHSLGGAVAQALAVRHPEKVSAMLLVDAAPPGGFVTPEPHYQELEAMRANRELLALSLAAVTPTRQPENFQALVDDALSMTPAAYQGNARSLASYDLRDRTPAVAVPVTVLRGANDLLVDAEAAAVTAAAYPQAKLITWEGIGHSPPTEAPDRFRDLLSKTFLSTPGTGGAA